jgi:hypothetical protein
MPKQGRSKGLHRFELLRELASHIGLQIKDGWPIDKILEHGF